MMTGLLPGQTRDGEKRKTERTVRRLLAADWTRAEVAAELGIHPDSVSRIKRRMEKEARS